MSKLGAIAIDKRNILILGGIGADYESVSSVYNLDVIASKFIKRASMRSKRFLRGGVFVASDKLVYVLNGASNGDNNCERFNV